jgi:hypothetical protein
MPANADGTVDTRTHGPSCNDDGDSNENDDDSCDGNGGLHDNRDAHRDYVEDGLKDKSDDNVDIDVVVANSGAG